MMFPMRVASPMPSRREGAVFVPFFLAVLFTSMAALFTGVIAHAQAITAFGLQHTPLGQAQLTYAGGQLTVDNIGSSGQDGVSVALKQAQGVETQPTLAPPKKIG